MPCDLRGLLHDFLGANLDLCSATLRRTDRGFYMRFLFVILLLFASAFPLRAGGDLSVQIQMARADHDRLAEIDLLRRWLDKCPDDVAARRRLVSLWLDVSDYNMAESALADWNNPEPGFAARTKAQIAWQRDTNIERALDFLRKRAKAAPSDRETRLLLSTFLARDGFRPEQVAVLDKLIAEKPSGDLLLDRALARRLLDDPARAVADARNASAMDPESSRIKNALPEFERLEKALAQIARIQKDLVRDPGSPSALFERSLWQLYASLPAKALADAESGLKRMPGSASGKILKTRSLLNLGKIDRTKALIDLSVDTTKPLETPELLKGIFLGDKMIENNSKNPQAYVTRSFHLNNDCQYLLAVIDCRSALDLDPSNLDALNNAALASCRLGNLPVATAYAQKLESLKPPPATLARVLGFLADMAFSRSNYSLAIDYADRSLFAKSDPAIWKVKAAALTRLGRAVEAEAALKAVKDSGSTNK